MGMVAILVNEPQPFLAIFRSSDLRSLNMKFEQIWLSVFRGEVF